MDELSNANFIDPRLQQVEATTTRLYNPAMKEMGFSVPLTVAIYNQVRYYEDYGKLKCGYSVASKETLAEQFGVTVKQVERAFDNLTNKYKLGGWVVCDEKIFRNVKKVWVSHVRQGRGSMEDTVRMLENSYGVGVNDENSYSVGAKLLQRRSKTPTVEELPTGVPPLSESNIKEGNTKGSVSGMGTSTEEEEEVRMKPAVLYSRVKSIWGERSNSMRKEKVAGLEKLQEYLSDEDILDGFRQVVKNPSFTRKDGTEYTYTMARMLVRSDGDYQKTATTLLEAAEKSRVKKNKKPTLDDLLNRAKGV